MVFTTLAMSCYIENSIKMVPTSIRKQLSNQHSNLDRFSSQLGSILGGFWGPRWGQVGPNRSKNRSSSRSEKWSLFESLLGPILVDFGLQLDSQEGAPEIIFQGFWGSWSHLGAKMAPRPSQEPTRAPKTPPRPLQEAPWERFWAPSWWIFDPKLTDLVVIWVQEQNS